MATRRSTDFDSVTELRRDALGVAPAGARPGAAEIVWTDAAGAEHRAVVDRPTVVGTAERADVVLADPTVSRLHAEFAPRHDGLWVTDLRSRNGTFVEGVLVAAARVPHGGRVQLGATTLTARYEAGAARASPADAGGGAAPASFGPLVGQSAAMRALFARLARVAASDAAVLIQGETGTGKELVAWALHEHSPRGGYGGSQPPAPRAPGAFVVVDCAALPESLLEAELFGHAKGAFTGAADARAGAIEAAEGGTVFLDEVGELPLAMQPKLLRALESRTVRRLGETQHRPVNVRFVSATHRDLRAMVNAGTFREDLYFRLAVLPVEIPPLRERPEDIPALVARFAPPGTTVGAELLRELAARAWPGNVRELRNFVERALVLGAHEALALGAPAPRPSSAPAPGAAAALPPVSTDRPFKAVREQWLDHLEREYVRALLAQHGRNVSAVADAAGLDRSYVHRLIRKHDL